MDEVSFEGKNYIVVKEEMGNLPLIVVRAKRGYIACSYIDKETAEKVGDIAAFVPPILSTVRRIASTHRSAVICLGLAGRRWVAC